MLKVKNLKFRIDGLNILRGVNCKIEKGEVVGVIGPNGSGKTTFFNCLSGFNMNVEGSIEYKEEEIVKLEPHVRSRKGIGRVFQNFGIFREMTLIENILTALEARDPIIKGLFPWSKRTKEYEKIAMEILTEVNLQHMAHQKAEKLSGGQMRLLEIIRGVAFGAELFMLDEPTAGVSPRMKDEVSSQIRKLADRGHTILIIEHDIHFIEQLCDRILVMNEGEIVLDGSPQEVRGDTRLQEIYFGKTG